VDFYTDKNGVVRWLSNDNVPFDDKLGEFVKNGLISQTTMDISSEARRVDVERFLSEYSQNYNGPSEEEKMEAMAAFGPGVTLVNVVTGHKWITG
jgi:hypothetical protein